MNIVCGECGLSFQSNYYTMKCPCCTSASYESHLNTCLAMCDEVRPNTAWWTLHNRYPIINVDQKPTREAEPKGLDAIEDIEPMLYRSRNYGHTQQHLPGYSDRQYHGKGYPQA